MDNPEESNRRFKEISEAYEVLSDAYKRHIYDNRGTRKSATGTGGGSTGSYTAFTNRDYSRNGGYDHYHHHRYGSGSGRYYGSTGGRENGGSSSQKKRRIYDQYGKDGLMNNGSDRYHQSTRHRRHNGSSGMDDFEFFGFPFTFRDPEDVFREFFGGSPFDELFRISQPVHQHGRRANGATNGHHHHHQRHSHPQNVISSPFMTPLINFSLMDDFFSGAPRGGMSSVSEYTIGGGGPVKRTSTSTTFINGKKLMTKKVYENGTETIMSYENDVLKSKTVNGVAQAIPYNH
uniref:J domain-containing protein n=1 Tax=Anopheles melas TaxID=34690 RepID=A0A182TPE0_9DIPT